MTPQQALDNFITESRIDQNRERERALDLTVRLLRLERENNELRRLNDELRQQKGSNEKTMG